MITVKRKHVVLTIREKMAILKAMANKTPTRVITEQYGIGSSTLSDIKKNSEQILDYFKASENLEVCLERKRMKKPHNLQLDNALYKWYKYERSCERIVTGPMLADKAMMLNSEVGGDPNFKASSGWLSRFKNRHGIKGSISTGAGAPRVNMPHNHIPDPHSVAIARCRQMDDVLEPTNLLETECDEQPMSTDMVSPLVLSFTMDPSTSTSFIDLPAPSSSKSISDSPQLLTPKPDPDGPQSSYVPLSQMQNQNSQPSSPQKRSESIAEEAAEEVCLRWNSHHANMKTSLPSLLDRERYVDCSLAVDGQILKCHRVILSSCSAYFDEMLSGVSIHQHPVIFLKGIPYWILKSLIDFMYAGEVHIDQNKLQELLEVAEALKIKGLAGKSSTASNQQNKSQSVNNPITTKPLESLQQPSKINPIIKSSNRRSVDNLPLDISNQAMEISPLSPVNISQPSSDPLSLLQPIYYEDPSIDSTTKTLSTANGNPIAVKRTYGKKVRKRRLSEHEISPPPVIHRKGTKSRPIVKMPKHYHDGYESVDLKHAYDDIDIDHFTIKNEPLDIEENDINYGIQDLDNSTKEANENLNILDSLQLKSITVSKTEQSEEHEEKKTKDDRTSTKEQKLTKEDQKVLKSSKGTKSDVVTKPKIKIVNIGQITESAKVVSDEKLSETDEILSKMEKTGAVEVTPITSKHN